MENAKIKRTRRIDEMKRPALCGISKTKRLRMGSMLFYVGKRDYMGGLPEAVGYLWPVGTNKPHHFVRKWWRFYFVKNEEDL